MLQDGLEAELVSNSEIMIKGFPRSVTIDSSDGPSSQKSIIPASAAAIRAAETNLQHMVYEHGLSSDDMTGIRHHETHAIFNK